MGYIDLIFCLPLHLFFFLVSFYNPAVPEVDFAVKIQELKAQEREDALFQCVLTAPMNEIKWFGKSAPLSNSDKHEIIVSEDKLIHKLIVRDCLPLDAGIYTAVAGIKSCNAWLVVEGKIMLLFYHWGFPLCSRNFCYMQLCDISCRYFPVTSNNC